METKIANILSVVLHPLLMPTFGTVIMLNIGIYLVPPDLLNAIYMVVFLTTFLLPIIFIPLLKYMYIVNDIKLATRKERIYPMALTIVCYFFGLYLLAFGQVKVPEIVEKIYIGSIVTMLIALMITLRWKISTHTAGIGGIIGLVFSLVFKFYIDVTIIFQLTFIAAGIIGVSRLRLNAHTPSQVYWGFALGFICFFVIGLMDVKI